LQLPQAPQPAFNHDFQPINPMSRSGYSMGGNNLKSVQENNLEIMRHTGGYASPIIPPNDPTALHDFILQRSGYMLDKREQEIAVILQEAHESERNKKSTEDEFKNLTQAYTDAFQNLMMMFSGTSDLSLKDAYYIIESAYDAPYLTKQEFDRCVKTSADFIRNWLAQGP